MKKFRLLILTLFIPLLNSAQTTVTLGIDSISVLNGPIIITSAASANTHSWSMSIYDQPEILTAGGYASAITKVSWFKTDSGSYLDADAVFEIYIKHTALSSFSSPANFNNEVIGADLVFSSITYKLTSAIGWVDINLDNYFSWNGVDNIMIITRWVRIGNGSAAVHWRATASASPQLSYSSSTSATMGTLLSNVNRPNVKLQLTPQATDDAGVVSIDSVRGRCPGNIDVYSTFQNYGINALTSATIQWEVDGILQAPYNFAGNLASGAKTQVLLGNVTYSAGVSHSIKAWTDAPNAGTDTNNINDTLLLANIFPGLSGTYTIGATGDFTSFTDAAEALGNNGVCGPVEIIVDPGIYQEQVEFKSITNASSVNNILIHSSTNDSTDVVLEWPASATADSNYTMRLAGASYITFNSITFSRTGSNTFSTVVEMTNGSHDVVFQSNQFLGPDSTTAVNTAGTKSAIFCPGTMAWDNLKISNNYFQYNSNGVWVNGASSDFADSVDVSDNIFETSYVGTFLLYQNSPVISRNIYLRSDTSTNFAYYAVSLRYGSGPVLITENKITGYTGSYGIRLRAMVDSSGVSGLIANNFVQSGTTSTGRGLALEESCSGIDIFHNSINYTGTTTTTGRAMFIDGANTAGIRLLNNIFYNSGGGYATYVSANATAGVLLSDNNCLYSTGASLAYYGAIQATLADLQTASSKDLNSVSGSPQFNSAFDLHTTSLLLSNAGSSTANIPFDIDGEARIILTPDIGADEYGNAGIHTTASVHFIKLYPNPAVDRLTIETENSGNWNVIISDMSGKTIFVGDYLSKKAEIDTRTFAEGVYLICVEGEDFSEKELVLINR